MTFPKGAKLLTYLRTEMLKDHTLSCRTYQYSTYMGVTQPLPSYLVLYINIAFLRTNEHMKKIQMVLSITKYHAHAQMSSKLIT